MILRKVRGHKACFRLCSCSAHIAVCSFAAILSSWQDNVLCRASLDLQRHERGQKSKSSIKHAGEVTQPAARERRAQAASRARKDARPKAQAAHWVQNSKAKRHQQVVFEISCSCHRRVGLPQGRQFSALSKQECMRRKVKRSAAQRSRGRSEKHS